MRPLSVASALSLASILAACAAEPVTPPSAAPSANAMPIPNASTDEMVCTREYPIGSNIPVTKCRSRAQIEADRAAAQENLHRNQSGAPNSKPGG
jgi:hypothetical protein